MISSTPEARMIQQSEQHTVRRAAQIVFTQSERVFNYDGSFAEGRWTARLLSRRVIDRTYGTPVGRGDFTCYITGPNALDPKFDDGWFTLVTQGAEKGGRRYREFRNLSDAQTAAIKWAARRFYIEVPA